MKITKQLFGALIVLTLLISACSQGDSITKEEFSQIQNGMNYSECVSIIGFEGSELSTVESPAIPGVMEEMTVTIYSWVNWDGSNMTATFTNGKLDTKMQIGL